MTTRREMNSALGIGLSAFCSGMGSALLDAQGAPEPVKTLLQQPLGDIPNPEVNMLILNVAPGAVSRPHKHFGPVYAYILGGKIENQVDPEQPKTYGAGDFFYEPAMHVHRELRNLSKTETARILVFLVQEKGKPSAIGAE
jgi:quercetin dioxygenase-like cupin family protein